MNKEEKQFGLIKPKAALSVPRAGNIFGDDDDSEGEEGVDWVKKALKAEGDKARRKKQTKLSIAKALNEDPTIYQYDEIYEKLEKKEMKKPEVKKEVKKPKYLHNFMKNAERRKREQEHRIERMVQKEREAEGAEFADKESFVTSAYRAKLEEFKKMEEEEERMDRLEAIGDVTKQKDLSGFYRHIFAQSIDGSKDEESLEKPPEVDQDSSESESTSEKDESSKFTSKSKKSRQYRRRKVEESASEESETEEQPLAELEDMESSAKKPKLDETPEINESNVELNTAEVKSSEEDLKKIEKPESKVTRIDLTKSEDLKHETEKKINIWEKRTIGLVFEAALQRYYARKSAKLSGLHP